MGQRKTILFLGRRDLHMGYEYCRKLCHRKKWKLVVAAGDRTNVSRLIKQVDAVFTTGYLGMLEAYICQKPVLTTWTNPLKEDYIKMHPMYGKTVSECYRWAKMQTWDKVTDIYEKLWQK